jgi:hypothetical protein
MSFLGVIRWFRLVALIILPSDIRLVLHQRHGIVVTANSSVEREIRVLKNGPKTVRRIFRGSIWPSPSIISSLNRKKVLLYFSNRSAIPLPLTPFYDIPRRWRCRLSKTFRAPLLKALQTFPPWLSLLEDKVVIYRGGRMPFSF